MTRFARKRRNAAPPTPVLAPAEPIDVAPHGDAAVPPAVRTAAAWSWRVLVIIAVVAVAFFLLAKVEVIAVPVAVAVLLTVLLMPVRTFLERRLHFPRGLAAGTALIGLILVVVGLVVVAGGTVASGFQDLADQAKAGFSEFLDWLSDGPLGIDVSDLDGYIDDATSSLSGSGSTIVSGALGAATTVGHVLAGSLIALFCTFFFLHDGRRIWSWVVGLLPVRSRDTVHQAGRRGFVTLSAYARTQILVAFVDSVGIGIGAAILQVPLAIPLAILVFVGSFVPVVGAVLTGTVAILVALVANGWLNALIMLGVVLLVQQIEGHLLQPFLMGHALSLHPVAVLLAVAAGGFTAGIVGALFAVPLAATINTVVLYFHGHDKFPELGTDDRLMVRGSPALPAIPPAVLRAELEIEDEPASRPGRER